MKVPVFDDVDGGGIMRKDFTFITPITGHYATAPYTILLPGGSLYIQKGYKWNYGNWPAINTKTMKIASLPHDAFYGFLEQGKLPQEERAKVDAYFRDTLKRHGVWWLRRWCCWIGVRVGGYFYARG